jgi:hypothetical protein
MYSYGASAELRHDATSSELRALFVRHEHGASARRSDRLRQADAVRCLCTPPGGYVHRPVWTQWIYFDSHLMGLTYVRLMCPFMALVLELCWSFFSAGAIIRRA